MDSVSAVNDRLGIDSSLPFFLARVESTGADITGNAENQDLSEDDLISASNFIWLL